MSLCILINIGARARRVPRGFPCNGPLHCGRLTDGTGQALAYFYFEEEPQRSSTTASSHQLLISGKCKKNSSARIKRLKLLFGTYFHPEVLAGPATGSRHHAQAETRG